MKDIKIIFFLKRLSLPSMEKVHVRIKEKIISFIDFFYPPFKKFIPKQTFRYAVCGGANLLLSLFLFYIFFHFVVFRQNFSFRFFNWKFVLKPHTAALILAFIISTPVGFYLNLSVVFPGSHLKRRVQFSRYILVCLMNLVWNYLLLKLFVEILHLYPTYAIIVVSAIVVVFTYIAQRYFSFRQKKN